MERAYKGNSGEPYLSVLVPMYNEEKNIESTILKVSEKLNDINCTYEFIVVDDGSRDSSVQIVKRLRQSFPNIFLFCHPSNRGPGTGIVSGIPKCRGEFIIFIPADLAMDLNDLGDYLEASKVSDVVVGLRSDRHDYSLFRKMISIVNIWVIKVLFLMPQKQFNYISMYRRKIFEKIEIESRSVFITAEIMIKARDLGFCLNEIEIGYLPRMYGASSTGSILSLVNTFKDLTCFWFKRIYKFYSLVLEEICLKNTDVK